MTTKHSAGPWEQFMASCANGDKTPAIKSTRSSACVGYPAGPTDEEIAANWAIQTLAPQMMEACQFMLKHAFERKWEGDEQAYGMLSRIVRAANA